MFNIDDLVRPNVRRLVPYSPARDEFSGTASVFLDANENSLGSPAGGRYNRYPDPHQAALKEAISRIKGVPPGNIFLGNGSDECIDVLYRAFSNPGRDNCIVAPPTYGMYAVSAHINDIAVREAPLTPDFELDLAAIEAQIDPFTRIVWLCSPNNPTGNAMDRQDIEAICHNFEGLVVVDEAYVNFSRHQSFIRELTEYPNLVVLQTLSKAWGLAGLRVGMAFASESIIGWMNKVKPPYNIGEATQELALAALARTDEVNGMTRELVRLREGLAGELARLSCVQHIYPSEANFLLVRMVAARKIYESLLARGIVLRDRSQVKLCEDCLRITVGTESENRILVNALETVK